MLGACSKYKQTDWEPGLREISDFWTRLYRYKGEVAVRHKYDPLPIVWKQRCNGRVTQTMCKDWIEDQLKFLNEAVLIPAFPIYECLNLQILL